MGGMAQGLLGGISPRLQEHPLEGGEESEFRMEEGGKEVKRSCCENRASLGWLRPLWSLLNGQKPTPTHSLEGSELKMSSGRAAAP